MGVDWYTCRGCDEPFNTCGDHFFCEECHNVQCYSCTDCESCKEYDLINSCKWCQIANELKKAKDILQSHKISSKLGYEVGNLIISLDCEC